VLLLIEKSAAVDSVDEHGQTPLLFAGRGGHEALVQLLVEKGTVVDSVCKYSQTPLSWPAENGHEAVVEERVSADDAFGEEGDILHLAIAFS